MKFISVCENWYFLFCMHILLKTLCSREWRSKSCENNQTIASESSLLLPHIICVHIDLIKNWIWFRFQWLMSASDDVVFTNLTIFMSCDNILTCFTTFVRFSTAVLLTHGRTCYNQVQNRLSRRREAMSIFHTEQFTSITRKFCKQINYVNFP